MTEEEKAAIEKAIADAKAMADSAQKTAEDALAKAVEGLVPVTADKVSFETDDANLKDADDVKAAIEKLAVKVWYTKISITSYTARRRHIRGRLHCEQTDVVLEDQQNSCQDRRERYHADRPVNYELLYADRLDS